MGEHPLKTPPLTALSLGSALPKTGLSPGVWQGRPISSAWLFVSSIGAFTASSDARPRPDGGDGYFAETGLIRRAFSQNQTHRHPVVNQQMALEIGGSSGFMLTVSSCAK